AAEIKVAPMDTVIGSSATEVNRIEADTIDYKKVAAMRTKYRACSLQGAPKRRLQPPQVMARWVNREGLSPNPGRCESLLMDLVFKWDQEEADHDCICVEVKPGCTRGLKHNRDKCEGGPRLTPPDPAEAMCLSISHTHLNQCLKNITGRAQVTLAPLLNTVADQSGRIDPKLVEGKTPALADAAEAGLMWEILSYTLDEEEPQGVAMIQRCINNKSHAQAVEHELQVLASLTDTVCMKDVQLANGTISEEKAKEHLRMIGQGRVVEMKNYRQLLQVALNMAQSPAWDNISAVHDWFNAPFAAAACIQLAYKTTPESPIEDGFCTRAPPALAGRLPAKSTGKQAIAKIEEHLRRFHITYDKCGAYQKMTPKERRAFLGKVGMELAEAALLGATADAQGAILEAACRCEDGLRAELADHPGIRSKLPPCPVQRTAPASGGNTAPALAAAQASALAPRLALYNADGVATEGVKASRMSSEEQAVEWESTLAMPGGGSLVAGKILRALALAHQQARISAAGLKVVATFSYLETAAAGSEEWRRDSGPQAPTRPPTDVKVFAAKSYKVGQLVLVPLPKSAANITSSSISDKAIPTVHSDEKSNPYNIVPSISWDAKTKFLHPFWLAQKHSVKQAANLHMITLSVMSTVKCQGDLVSCLADQLQSEATEIPVWTNPEDIEDGAEIVCHVPPTQKTPKAKTASTWLSQKTPGTKGKAP
ncbi:unnamed protein product, partial [Prorocentrum cordatum]